MVQDIWLKIKNFGNDFIHEWGLIVIIFLVAIASFGLGRLAVSKQIGPPISIGNAPKDVQIRAMAPGGLVVASRGGSTYQFPWCAGADRISATNKIWFKSEEAARQAGYAPAKNCKGLEK